MSWLEDASKDPRVVLYVAAVALSLILILTNLPGIIGASSGLKYGLDLEGGSWLQLQLQGGIAQIDADPARILEAQFNATSAEKRGDSYVIVVPGSVPATLADDLGYAGAKAVERDNTTRITIISSPESIITNYLQKRLDSDVKIVGVAPVLYEIRTNVTRESLNSILAEVGGSVVPGG
jgi:preprotein translocase subunit SecD